MSINKCKCEYYSKVTGERHTAIIADRFDFINIMDEIDIDFNKEIKIFEKDDEWRLAQHIVDGKTIYKNYSVSKDKEAEAHTQGLRRQNILDSISSFMTAEICPSRKENQDILEIMIDGVFCGEDISKPKLQLIGTESKIHS